MEPGMLFRLGMASRARRERPSFSWPNWLGALRGLPGLGIWWFGVTALEQLRVSGAI